MNMSLKDRDFGDGRPFLFDEKATYVPLLVVIAIMGSFGMGVFQLSKYVANQTRNDELQARHYEDVAVKLSELSIEQKNFGKELFQIRQDFNAFSAAQWSVTDMLLWCRETESINKTFKCPVAMLHYRERK